MGGTNDSMIYIIRYVLCVLLERTKKTPLWSYNDNKTDPAQNE